MNYFAREMLAVVFLAVGITQGCGGDSPPKKLPTPAQVGDACTADTDCASGLCEKPDGMCGAVDGACQDNSAGALCAQNQPECGCDGQTYASVCFRHRARVSKAHDGPC
jgi:hypothetical protein